MKYLLLCVLGMLFHSAAAGAMEAPRSTPLITVYGQVSESNRGALAPEKDLLFRNMKIGFESAVAFDRAMLEALPQVTLTADFPAGSPPRSFTGPRLSALLKAVGATGTMVKLTAVDSYTAEIQMADIARYDPVLAIAEDGRPLPLGGAGPAFLVFPRLSEPALKDMQDELWVWAVIAIEVH